jgi:hypothetical protein
MIMVHNHLPKAQETIATAALDGSLGYSLRRAQLSTYREYDSFMARFDIRPSQFAVLTLIRSNPGSPQSAISTALGIQKANFVSVIDRLESRGPDRTAQAPRRSSIVGFVPGAQRRTVCESCRQHTRSWRPISPPASVCAAVASC